LFLRIVAPDAAQRDAQSAVLAANWLSVVLRGVLAVAIGLFWFLADKGYLGFVEPDPASNQQNLAALYMGSLLMFLLLDGALAVVSGWRGARPGERFMPLILSGFTELFLATWVAMQRLSVVRAAHAGEPEASTIETVPAVPAEPAAAAPPAPVESPWPANEFWMDIGVGFVIVGLLLLAAAPGLNARYGRVWIVAAGFAWIASGTLMWLSSSSGGYAWMGDLFTIAGGVALVMLALQLLTKDKERTQRIGVPAA
jgi:hypothetical protein